MRIDVKNKKIIENEIYIHDYIFTGFTYNYNKNYLKFIINNHSEKTRGYSIVFENVIGFNMLSCDYWGPSIYILDWELLDISKESMVGKIIDEQKNNNYEYSRIDINKEYIESKITFISGDTITIACEYLNVDVII